METTFRTMLMAAAGLLVRVAAAHAQPSPDVSAATPPEEPTKKSSPFEFTRFTWNNSASTKIFGVGADYQGHGDEQYSMDFGFNVRYAFVNEDRQKAYVNARFGFQIELTNSDKTRQIRETLLRDLGLHAAYHRVAYRSADKETETSPELSVGLILPTSLASRSEGKYVSTSLNATVIHAQRLAGSEAAWLPGVLAYGTFGWSHLFARSYNAVNDDVERPRQTATGAVELSDQLTMDAFEQDSLRFNLTYHLGVYKDALSLVNTWELHVPFKHDYRPGGGQGMGCDVAIVTDPCVIAERLPDRTHGIPATTFDLSLAYAFPENLGRVDVGYLNAASQLREGKRVSVFYGPGAMFYLNLVAYFDGIYGKAARQGAEPRRRLAELPRFGASSR